MILVDTHVLPWAAGVLWWPAQDVSALLEDEDFMPLE